MKAFEQRHALAKGRLEADFAPHGALGDLRDFRLDAEFGGEFVDTFLLDDGGIHVRNEELLAAAFRLLCGKVDFRLAECRACRCLRRCRVAVKGDVAGFTFRQPHRFTGCGQGAPRCFDMRACKRRGFIAYQGQDIFHRGNRKEPYVSVAIGRAVLIAGPTASGKSALALAVAERFGGEIINADSMQLYREMRIITARPSREEEARVPHHLYGVTGATEPLSAGRWAVRAAERMREIADRGALPVVVGGTGLYLRALIDGLSPVPQIEADLREAVRAEVAAAGESAHALLRAVDPVLAGTVRPSDLQRISRGIEVARATGRPLSEWQRVPPQPLVTGNFARIVLTPERGWLRERIDRRFDLMLDEGALEEARFMAGLGLDPDLPAMKALGLRPLIRHIEGEISLEEAAELGKRESRAYAKRQETWFRTQMIAWNTFFEQYSERLNDKIFSFVDELGLTRP